MLGFAEAGQVGVDDSGQRAFVTEVDLDLAKVLALLEHVRGVRVPQGVHMSRLLDPAGVEGQAEGPLQGGTAHGLSGGFGALTTVALGREEQRGMAMGFPLLAQQEQRAFGQRDVAIAIALAGANVQEPPL